MSPAPLSEERADDAAWDYVCRLCGWQWQTIDGLWGHIPSHGIDRATYGMLVAAEAEVARLTEERDALKARLAAAEAERDRLIGAITPLGRCLLCEKTVNAHRGWCALAARPAPEDTEHSDAC